MWYFGEFQFDDAARTLSVGTIHRALTPKACALLSCLLTEAGTIIPLRKLLTSVWRDIHVEPENVRVLVRELRRVLGDDARHPRFIRTYPNRGYVFVAPTTTASGDRRETNATHAGVLVGRDGEMDRLTRCLDVARRGSAAFALVTGDVGLGKTALSEAFVHEARTEGGVSVASTHCVEPFDASEPDDPLFDVIARLRRQVSDPESVPPYPSHGSAAEAAASLMALGRTQPLLAVIHHFHLAAPHTIGVLRSLTQTLNAPVMFLIAARDVDNTRSGEELARWKHDLERVNNAAVLTLGSLTRDDVDALVAGRLGPGSVTNAISGPLCEVTEGNPFLAVTALDGFMARGFVRPAVDGWKAVIRRQAIRPALTACMLPALEWRLDQLDDVERRILEAAALSGPVFGASDLTVSAREPEDMVSDVLERLLGRGGLIVRAMRRGPAIPADRYRFTHSLSPRLLALRGASTADLRRAHRLFPPRAERPRPPAA